ncbi:hypothetical protein TNCV_3033341 [Trichonephila clavipes]|nr:hypothetical protein TNCV_3033341 [Trichonephila clavipes]
MITLTLTNQRAASKLSTMQKILPLHHKETLRHASRFSSSQPITVMPLSRLQKSTFAVSHFEVKQIWDIGMFSQSRCPQMNAHFNAFKASIF